MQLARVVGHVVVTRKETALTGITLLIVQPLGADGQISGRPLVAADAMGAGPGEVVFFVRGREASLPFPPPDVPVDAAVVGIVDSRDYTAPGATVPAAAPPVS
jgi:ethanolamine utilization protein EutN